MVRKHEKYYWRNREHHFAGLNLRKAMNKRICDAIILGSGSLFKKLEQKQFNRLLSYSEQWPPDMITRFEAESGTTNPDTIFMKPEEP